MEKLGFSFDEVALKKAAALNENIEKLELATGNLKNKIVMGLVPGLLNMSEAFLKDAKDGGTFTSIAGDITWTIKALMSVGILAAQAFTGLAGSFLLAGAGVYKLAEGANWLMSKVTFGDMSKRFAFLKNQAADYAASNIAQADNMFLRAESYGKLREALWDDSTSGKPLLKKPKEDAPLLGTKDTGAADRYASALRSITDETTAWSSKIDEMNPELEKEDSAILKLTNDSEALIKKIKEQGAKEKIDTTSFTSTISAKLEEGKAYAILAEQKKYAKEYEDLMSSEGQFAQTENERAINAIIVQEQKKIDTIDQAYEKGAITMEQWINGITTVVENADAAQIEIETEKAKKIADINYSLIQGIAGMNTWAHELRLSQIDAQAAAYAKDGAAPRAIEAWKTDQTMRAGIKTAISGNDYAAGYQAQLEQYKLDMKSAGEYGSEVFKSQAGAIKSSIGGVFSDLRKGELKDFSSYFSDFADKMLSVWEDMTADMLTNWITTGQAMKSNNVTSSSSSGGLSGLFGSLVSGISSLFGGSSYVGDGSAISYSDIMAADESAAWGYHGGGVPGYDSPAFTRMVDTSTFANAPRFHSGIGPGERAAIIRDDEGVFTPGQMSALAPAGNTYQISVPVTISGENANAQLSSKLRVAIEKAVQAELKAAT
jgi:hypothetical protein